MRLHIIIEELCNIETGDFNQAIADLTQAIWLNINDADTYFNRGFAYHVIGEYDHAIADYTRAIRLNPNLTVAFISRGEVHIERGEYDQAIADFEAALRIDPADSTARENLEYTRQRKRG